MRGGRYASSPGTSTVLARYQGSHLLVLDLEWEILDDRFSLLGYADEEQVLHSNRQSG